MRLEVFIAELLYHHDCVVLPGFGGLVANYKSAVLNSHSHIVSPPAKQVGFNRHLKNNDGLLASHIASTLQIEYKQGLQLLEYEIVEYNTILSNEGRVSLKNIGLFYNDKSGSLQFMPDEQENFLLSSYGLKSLQLKPVKQQVISSAETLIVTADKSQKSHHGWKVAAAIAIPLMIGASLLVNNKIKHGDNFNFASLNPFAQKKSASEYLPRVEAKADQQQLISELPVVAPWPHSTNRGIVKYNFLNDRTEEEGISVRVEEKNVEVNPKSNQTKENRETIKNSVRGKFAVIGGAFSIKENANKFLEALKGQGFDAHFVGTKDGLQLVAYGMYDTKVEAENALRNIRNNDNRSAWIRRN